MQNRTINNITKKVLKEALDYWSYDDSEKEWNRYLKTLGKDKFLDILYDVLCYGTLGDELIEPLVDHLKYYCEKNNIPVYKYPGE